MCSHEEKSSKGHALVRPRTAIEVHLMHKPKDAVLWCTVEFNKRCWNHGNEMPERVILIWRSVRANEPFEVITYTTTSGAIGANSYVLKSSLSFCVYTCIYYVVEYIYLLKSFLSLNDVAFVLSFTPIFVWWKFVWRMCW